MSSNQPLVSVVIPCYNHEKFVQHSIQSVINQTYENIELIIIDDGSKDNSVIKIQEMVESCKKRFVRFEFRNRLNLGLSSTLNEGLNWAKGKFFSPLASDDSYLMDKILIQVQYLLINYNVVALSGNIIYIDENDIKISQTSIEEKKVSFTEIITHNYFLPAASQIIKTDVIKRIGGYDEILLIEDWDMWLRIAVEGEIYFIKDVLAHYRIHGKNTSKNSRAMNRDRLIILKKYKEDKVYFKALSKTIWINFKQTNSKKISFFKRVLKWF